MGLADTAKLIVDLSLKGNFQSQLAASQKQLSSFDRQIDGTGTRAFRAGQQIGTGIKRGAVIAAGAIGFLATQVGFGLRSLAELDDIVTQTNAVLRSTKGVSGETAASVRKLAEQYESLNATIDDKVIQSGENLLLTFTNIRKDAFEPALKAALDMNTALGRGEQGLQGTIQQLGVALNDPIKGLQRLQRAGIIFTDGQKAQIAAAVKAGDTFKAQSIILDELNKRYGGSFLAGGQTTTGKIAKFKDAIDDLQRALATALLPTIGKVADKLTAFLADPKVVQTVSQLGEKIASLFSDQNLAAGGRALSSIFETARTAAPILESAAGATLKIVQAAVGLFQSLPAPLQQLAVGAFAINKLTGGLVTNVAGGIKDALGSFLSDRLGKGGNPANPLFVFDVSGGAGVAGAAGAAGSSGLIGALKFGLAGLVATGIVAAAVPIGKAFADALPPFLKGANGQGQSDSQLAHDRANAQSGGVNNIQGIASGKINFGPVVTAEKATTAAIRAEAAENRGVLSSNVAKQVAAVQEAAARQVHTTERTEANAANRVVDATKHVALVAARAAGTVAARVDRARQAQVAASLQVARTVKAKKLAVTVHNAVTAQFTYRSVINGTKVVSSYGHTAVARGQQTVIS